MYFVINIGIVALYIRHLVLSFLYYNYSRCQLSNAPGNSQSATALLFVTAPLTTLQSENREMRLRTLDRESNHPGGLGSLCFEAARRPTGICNSINLCRTSMRGWK